MKPGSVTTRANITAARVTGTTRPSSQHASSTTGSLKHARYHLRPLQDRFTRDFLFHLDTAANSQYDRMACTALREVPGVESWFASDPLSVKAEFRVVPPCHMMSTDLARPLSSARVLWKAL